jgi:hypothetical protein
MNKQEFVTFIEQLKLDLSREDEFNDALDDFDKGNYHCFVPYRHCMDEYIIPLLKKVLGLSDENEDLEWWVYDTNFGREGDARVAVEGVGTFNCINAEVFYDCLEEMKKAGK